MKVCKNCEQRIQYTGLLILFVLIALLPLGCASHGQHSAAGNASTLQAPDYSRGSDWVFKTGAPDKAVDVFYVYPTIYVGKSPTNMDIHDQALRGIAEHLMDAQAGAYSGDANLFAPYYRQMSMAMLDSDEDMYKSPYFQTGYGDVSRAFDYYLKHFNNGRPFILAGHSQGTMVLINLMRDRFDDPRMQKQLVAAYLIGYSITREDLKNYPWMKPATRANDIGVIISYNTQAPGTTASPVLLPNAYCINPLSWTTDETPADKSLNLGAVFFNGKTSDIEREVLHYTGARVDKATGALVAILPETLDVGGFPPGVYHKYDYALWFRNLKANVALRIHTFLGE
jgi:pimeloyl-ACP methyl ester carboxylesterase